MNNICIFFFANRIILICRNFGWKLKKYSIYLLESSREVCLIDYIVIHVHQYRGNFFLHSNINKSIKRLTRLIRDDLTSIRCSFVLICNTRSFDPSHLAVYERNSTTFYYQRDRLFPELLSQSDVINRPCKVHFTFAQLLLSRFNPCTMQCNIKE